MTATLTTHRPTTTQPTTAAAAEAPASLWAPGLLAAVVAGAATTAVAAVAQAADVAVVSTADDAIPLAGFAQLTIAFSVVGILLARSLRRRAARPARTFRRATMALTALSIVPDLLLPTDATSKAVLVATHLVAAAIVVPVLARRLPEAR